MSLFLDPSSTPALFPVNMHPGKQQVMALIVGSLHKWEVWPEFLSHSFGLVQLQLLKALLSDPLDGNSVHL